MCVCVCVCVCMYIHIHIYTYIYYVRWTYIYNKFICLFVYMSENINEATRHLKFCYISIFYKSSTD